MKKFTGLTASKCQSAFCPKIYSQDLGFSLYFQFVCLLFWGEMFLLLLLACFIVASAYLIGVVAVLIACLVVFGWFLLSFGLFCGFFGGWIFYLLYKVICTVQAGLKYSLFLCAPFLIQRYVLVTFIFYQVFKLNNSVQIFVSLSMIAQGQEQVFLFQ